VGRSIASNRGRHFRRRSNTSTFDDFFTLLAVIANQYWNGRLIDGVTSG
jgi:hypothetical protein